MWFTWPAWPLALWTLWRWRYQLKNILANPHLSLPLWFVAVSVITTWLSGLSDRALLLSLPAMATLAAFALPTLRRSVGAFIDWFTLVFFSAGALIIWVVWTSMHTGVPAQPAINVARLAPGFTTFFSGYALIFAVMASLVWASLVKWRAGRHRSAIWKSMALPAGGATLCWLLVMTLWLPLLNFARSYEPLVLKVKEKTGPTSCAHYHGLTRAQGAAFEFHGQMKLLPISKKSTEDARPKSVCDWLIVDTQAVGNLKNDIDMSQWVLLATVRRPSDNNEDIILYKSTTSTAEKH